MVKPAERGIDMDKTKKDLERENNFLRLQLKIISELIKECSGSDLDKTFENIGAIKYYSERYQEDLNFIVERDLPYNFYNKTMSV